ncbi:MAG: sugar phosphate nucleotidyltransferase [Acidimicrobiales bacterium]
MRLPVVGPGLSVGDTFLEVQDGHAGLVVVAGDDGTVLGTVTDGDIRRAVLAGLDLATPVGEVMGDQPVTVAATLPDTAVRDLLERRHLRAAAVVEGRRLVGVRTRADVGGHPPSVTAVVLAGGRGQRLRPLTDKVPKPLLTVGRATVVERLLDGLGAAGVGDVYLSVNYKAELFEERLGDGARHGVRLHYLRERKQLGTAGPLSLLPGLGGALLVVNAKQITTLDLGRLVDFHLQEGAAMTVAAFTHEVHIPYGVLDQEGGRLTRMVEKPTQRHLCNAGMYVLGTDLVGLVPRNTYFGMPQLLDATIAGGRPAVAFPILETVIHIATREDLDRALLYVATGEEVR